MNVEFQYELGAVARDRVTGFVGTITSSTMWLNGCKQYCLKAKLSDEQLKKGTVPEGEWFDEGQLEIVDDSESVDVEKKNVGGPQSDTPPSTCNR